MITISLPDVIVHELGRYRCVPTKEHMLKVCDTVLAAVDALRIRDVLSDKKEEPHPQMELKLD